MKLALWGEGVTGEDQYADQFEDEAELEAQVDEAEPTTEYAHLNITCLKGDDYEDIVAYVSKGSEVAVYETTGDWVLIRCGGSKG